MKNFSKSNYLKSELNKINNLFVSGKFDMVIEKSKKIIKKNPRQIPFYNFLSSALKESKPLALIKASLLGSRPLKLL